MSSSLVIKDVKTPLWNQIIDSYKADGWKTEYEYDQFDKGIDHDFVRLSKNGEVLLFGWDNWFEGEIRCSDERRSEMEARFNLKFKLGEGKHLNPEMIEKERWFERRQKKVWWQFWK